MLRTFDCPKCGAPVSYEQSDPLSVREITVRCDYCHSRLMVPNEMRGQPARVVPIKIHLGFSSGQKVSKRIWWLLAIPLLLVVIGGLAVAGIMAPVIYSISRAVKDAPKSGPADKPTSESRNEFANVVLKFGSEGIGPGMFTDARSIGVDASGRIYVGEYTGGRVQVFDQAGKFITQWSIGDRKTILRGLAANRKGTVYVVHGGHIYRYDGETGQQAGQIQFKGNSGFDDVATAADGGLVAAYRSNRDDIVRFDSNGTVVKTLPAAISSVSGDSELSMRVAIDGLGNIYALGRFNNAVFKFTPEGKFVNRFGGAGDQPGQLRAAYCIAVDGKGRVYVGDTKGIQVFDENGRYLTVFKSEGSPSGMVFNDNNELFVVARDHVVKFALRGD